MKHFPVVGLIVVMAMGCGQRGSSTVDTAQPESREVPEDVDTGSMARPNENERSTTVEAAPAEAPASVAASIQFLGRSRMTNDAILGRNDHRSGDGWVDSGDDWAVLYEGGCAVELRVKIASGVDCREAARALGLGDVSPPLRRARRCEWPGLSGRHVLGLGLAGELDLETGVFHVRRVGNARRCDEVRECPHSFPRDASSCVPTDHAACTYTGTDPDCRTRIATCRDGQWRVECMP